MEECNIEIIPSDIMLLTKLTILYLHNNKINFIPNEIKYLIKLNDLQLSKVIIQ